MGLLSLIYRSVITGRRLLYSHLKRPERLPARVISIGNLTLGGTGKTPAVIAIAEEALRRGFKPCVLTRGYKGRAKGLVFVSRGEAPLLDAHQAGDEPLLMAERLRGVPVVMGKRRYEAGILALEDVYSMTPKTGDVLFILDDGFQHLSLHRDVDILLIDAADPFGNERLLPEGRLREPLSAMKRADIIVITKADMAGEVSLSGLLKRIRRYNPESPVYRAYHRPTRLTGPTGESRPIEFLNNRRIHAFAGIANPAYFKAILDSKGASVLRFKTFRDHYAYKQKDIDRIEKEAAGLDIITTEKDLVKLRMLDLPKNIFAMRIEFSIDSAFYDDIFRLACS